MRLKRVRSAFNPSSTDSFSKRKSWRFPAAVAFALIGALAVLVPLNARADVIQLASYQFDELAGGQEVNTGTFALPGGTNRAIVFSHVMRTNNTIFTDNNIAGLGEWVRLNGVNSAETNFTELANQWLQGPALPSVGNFYGSLYVLFVDDSVPAGDYFVRLRIRRNLSERKAVNIRVFGNVNPGVVVDTASNAGNSATTAAGALTAGPGSFGVDSVGYRQHTQLPDSFSPGNKQAIMNGEATNNSVRHTTGFSNNPPASSTFSYTYPGGTGNQFTAVAAQFQMAYRITVSAGTGGSAYITSPGTTQANFTFNNFPTVVAVPGPGYIFAGWTVSQGGVADASQATTTPNQNAVTTLVANFQQVFDLTLSADPPVGGTVTPPGTTQVNANSTESITATPETGYQFDGWSTISGDSPADPGAASTSVLVTQNTELVANFSLQTFTVTFDLAGIGVRTGGGDLVQTVPFGSVPDTPIVEGNPPQAWTFTGWNPPEPFDPVTGPVTITAQFDPVEFTVTFDIGAGSLVSGDLVQTVQWGQAAVAPVVAPPSGFNFDGWDTAFDTITGQTTVTAQYSVQTFNVSFDLDGKGTRTGGGALLQTVDFGQAAVAPIVAGGPGWVFTGWDVPFDTITAPLTVIAQYDAEVTFDLDGRGTRIGGGDLLQVVSIGGAAIAPIVEADEGWTFTGWDVPFNNITGPLTVTAQYAPPAPPVPVGSPAAMALMAAGMAVGGIIGLRGMRRKP